MRLETNDRRLSRTRVLVLAAAGVTALYVAWGIFKVLS